MRRPSVLSVCTRLLLPGFAVVWCVLPYAGIKAKADTLYAVQPLGTLGTGDARATGINGSGVAVGYVTDAQGNSIAVTFNGQTNSLAGVVGQANGINSAGTVVGTAYTSNGPLVTEWSNGQVTNLGIAGYGTSINDAGEIGGGMLTPNGQSHAFLWTNGNVLDVGALSGTTWSSVYGINSSGEAVGTSMQRGRATAFVSNGNTLTPLAGSLGGASSYGMAINDSGVIVGSAQNARGYLNAFESAGHGMTNLGTLGGSGSAAYGINDAGTVVGYSFLAGNNATHAFVYLGGVLMDLNGLLSGGSGWTIDGAYGINNSGDIVGVGTLNGEAYAVELLPVLSNPVTAFLGDAPADPIATPEPAALLLTGVGLIVMARRFLRASLPA